MEQPKSILILQRVLVQYTLTEEDFKTTYADTYTKTQLTAMWERLVKGDPAPAPFLPDPCIGDRGIEDFGKTKTRVIELAETSNTALDASEYPELHEEVEEQLNDLLDTIAPEEEDKHFVIKKDTRILVCPDGTEKALEDTGCDHDDPDFVELYAEWNDIGVFFLPNGRRPEDGETEPSFWVQGQDPTYSGEELDETDGIVVRIA
jgi:hypothetical protein